MPTTIDRVDLLDMLATVFIFHSFCLWHYDEKLVLNKNMFLFTLLFDEIQN